MLTLRLSKQQSSPRARRLAGHGNAVPAVQQQPQQQKFGAIWYPHRKSSYWQADAAAAMHAATNNVAAIQPVESGSELRQVAQLRADAYYEDEHSRFVDTYKRQFVSREIASLMERTVPQKGAPAPECDCLVALAEDGMVLGCVDICLSEAACGVRPEQVPKHDRGGGYVKNVVVREDFRGQGVGKRLMLAAMEQAVQLRGVSCLYTTVDADNEIAYNLYCRCGFEAISTSAPLTGSNTLGSTVLLRWCPPARSGEQAA